MRLNAFLARAGVASRRGADLPAEVRPLRERDDFCRLPSRCDGRRQVGGLDDDITLPCG
jgi:hypothetical protein